MLCSVTTWNQLQECFATRACNDRQATRASHGCRDLLLACSKRLEVTCSLACSLACTALNAAAEVLHQDFLRSLLGVRKSTAKHMVLAELGRFPIRIHLCLT